MFILSTLFIILLGILSISWKNESFTEHYSYYFLNKHELFNLLKDDDDNFYKTFINNDYKSRNINIIDEYFNFIKNSVSEFTNSEKEKLVSCTKIVDSYFSNILYDWFDGKKANNILWKFGCIDGILYENGLPHTRSDTIILSKEHLNTYNDVKLIKTLIHEKIHVYQKLYPNDIKLYIKYHGFELIKKRDNDDNIRANPDTDNFIYKDKLNNIYKALYKDNPQSIKDVIYYPNNSQSCEHPYEKMAIDIEALFLENQ